MSWTSVFLRRSEFVRRFRNAPVGATVGRTRREVTLSNAMSEFSHAQIMPKSTRHTKGTAPVRLRLTEVGDRTGAVVHSLGAGLQPGLHTSHTRHDTRTPDVKI